MAIKKLTSRKFWNDTGKEAKARYRKFIFEQGQSVYGGDWWGGKYSPQYEKAKKSGKILRSAPAFANKVTPVLTSDLFKDFKKFLKVRNDGVQFGYATLGDRVKRMRDMKKEDGTLTSKDKPLPDSVRKYITDEYHKYIKKNQKNQTRTHKKGRTRTK